MRLRGLALAVDLKSAGSICLRRRKQASALSLTRSDRAAMDISAASIGDSYAATAHPCGSGALSDFSTGGILPKRSFDALQSGS
jgi:hypothetical protein